MNVTTVCPRECPGRYPGCGAKCEKFQAHREKSLKIYKKRRMQVEIGAVLLVGYRKTAIK